MYVLRSLVLAGFAFGCAQGGTGATGDDQPGQDASQKKDAAATDAPRPIDAPLVIDAPVSVDAFVPQDAASPFCTTNAMCTVAGECCLTLGGPMGFCVPGVIIAGVCFPQ